MYGQSFQTAYATELGKIGMKKYGNGDSGRPDEKDWRSGINERLMRYAEVLLMYAECQNELGNTPDCAKLIQQIRTRASCLTCIWLLMRRFLHIQNVGNGLPT
jgi:starch-binding outer membrane protein, SusD/RagB family